jgi:hypothetical protein
MIYISLTTIPKRLRYWASIQKNLISLLTQKTDKEYYVVFNIPKLYVMDDNTEYVVPDELMEFAKEHPNLIINRDIYDYGPIIKIYGVLKYSTNPEDIIIALDDDCAYHEDMIEAHLAKLNEYPNHVICYTSYAAARKKDFIEDGVSKFKLDGDRVDFPLQKDAYMLAPGHIGSVSYKRKYFKDDFNEELFSLADGDDPLMGYYLKMQRIPIICAKHNYPGIAFPIIENLAFYEYSGGWLIRRKYPETTHGRQSQKLMDFLYHNNNVTYINKL